MTTETKPKQFREIIGNKLRLNLHPGQTQMDDSEARFVTGLGGTQVGKTCYGPHWLDREIKRNGPGDYLAVTATFPLLNLKMLPEMRFVFEDLFHYAKYNKADRVFVFNRKKERENDVILFSDEDYEKAGVRECRIIMGSAQNPESIESATAKAAWLDEAGQKQFKRDSWEATLRRLSLAQGRILITTTLYHLGWLKNEIYDPWESGEPSIDVFQMDSIVNPTFPIEEYRRAKATMPDWKFQMFYRGRYSTPAGLIYNSFDSANHVIEPFKIPQTWPVFVGHDFGPVNHVALWYAQDPGTGYLYLFQEYLGGEKANWERIEDWKEMSTGYRIIKRCGGAPQEEEVRQGYTLAGWRIDKPTIKDVEVGITNVYGFHKMGKLFVFRTCLNYLNEKLTYSRELDDNYVPTERIEDKQRFHLMDAERGILSDFTPVSVVGGEVAPVGRRI